jgi:pilus assembly protein TadC
MVNLFFQNKYGSILKKSRLNYDLEKYENITFTFSFVFSGLITALIVAILLFNHLNIVYGIVSFIFFFIMFFSLIKSIPSIIMTSKKNQLESDLLYSARHLLLNLESGTALINALENVSKLSNNSSMYFKELVFDVSFGLPIEEALLKSIEYSPSKAYSKILQEIKTSLDTGSNLQKTLKNTLQDITKNHLILIQEYGKRLNPMTMFYMILGTILPSLGTAMLIVGASLIPGLVIIDLRILLFLVFVLIIVQLFFVLSFRSLKPAVMQ